MKTKKNIIKIVSLAIIAMLLITINTFATIGTDNSNMILNMPIIKIIIVVVACIIVTTLLYNVSQDTSTNTKELLKRMEKIEKKNQYGNEYDKKDNSIDKKIIERANEPEKPKKPRIREEFVRESNLDQDLLEEITGIYNKDNHQEEDIITIKEETPKVKEDITEEVQEQIKEEVKEEVKKVKEKATTKSDKLAEDFLNNLEMTMREGK